MNWFRACNQIESFSMDFSQNILMEKNVDLKISLKLFGFDLFIFSVSTI